MKIMTKLWVWIGILAICSPLGLIIPVYFKSSSAWGEWGAEEIRKLVGYVPRGLEKLSSMWNAPIPDYALKGWEEKGLIHLSVAYIVSAVVGIAIIVAIMFFIGKLLSKKGD
jgi:hypothetical protein